MNINLAQELLDQLGSSLENLETQQAALLQFLKDEGVVTEDKLAPYLAQAGKASNVRWRAAHIRLDRLISAEEQKKEQLAEKDKHPAGTAQASPQNQKETPKKDEANDVLSREAAAADAAKEGAESASDPGTNEKTEAPPASENKEPGPNQQTKGA